MAKGKFKANAKARLATKNKRYVDAKKRRRMKDKAKLQNSTQPTLIRTLRPSARKMLRAEKERDLYLLPWTKDIEYHYKHQKYPPASLLGLPPELRQKILRATLETIHIERFTRKSFANWIGNLCTVKPLIRKDMVYVAKMWKQEKMELERLSVLKRMQQSYISRSAWAQATLQPSLQLPAKLRKGKVNEVKGKKEKHYKLSKCWHCERRHDYNDPVCPPAREDLALWNGMTKQVKSRYVEQGQNKVKKGIVFEGEKTIFEDEPESMDFST